MDAGELTEEEAAQSERRNIILQALGPDPRVKVDLSHEQLRRGDMLILCSDGLSGVVRREELAQMVENSPDLPTLCSALIDLANERGGPDNVTVVAVRFDGDGLPAPDSGDGAGYHVYHVPDEPPRHRADHDGGAAPDLLPSAGAGRGGASADRALAHAPGGRRGHSADRPDPDGPPLNGPLTAE